ncbi:hypothetical protein HPB49_018191 [Dermacentor silvarum]|uniref:Uncharacterized protein n=1 Tax=Dermacentor silvarum TaxID=543639 RepID=A0ACB8DER5_DERSI|nr:hypothetical protein HPB49_018191 [Dermacentor silvarum]
MENHEPLHTLVEWLRQVCSSGTAVDTAVLKEKAEMVALRCKVDDFKPSNGWLEHFKELNEVVYSCCCKERTSVSPSAVAEWIALLPESIRQYKPSDRFSADETWVFYNLQLKQTAILGRELPLE